MDKLERQLSAHARNTARKDDSAQRKLTEEIASLDNRIGRLIDALENGLDADEVRKRLQALQEAKESAQIELRALTPAGADQEAPDAAALLASIPDLNTALRAASPEVKRQLFDAFDLQLTYDKSRQHLQISATLSEQLATALNAHPYLPPRLLPAAVDAAATATLTGAARVTRP